jgi:hypothetical protein
MTFRYRIVGALAGAFVLAASGLAAQSSERLTNKDVKGLIESVDQSRDRFEDQLDGKVKDGVLRSATGETKVSSNLADFQEGVERLKSRFTDAYAASAEVEAVLRRANSLDEMMKTQPSDLKGASEWNRLRADLGHLAAAYGATVPLAEGASVRRFNDAEVAAAAGAVAKQAEQIKSAANADKTLARPDKQALIADVNAVIEQAKTLQSRLKDGKPSTAELRGLRAKIAALTPEGRQLPPAVLAGIGGLRAPLEKLDLAFAVAAPKTF